MEREGHAAYVSERCCLQPGDVLKRLRVMGGIMCALRSILC
jgi:hypothetical protein